MTQQVLENTSVKEILAREDAHQKFKATAIQQLLAERKALEESTEKRIAEIRSELGALGYHRTVKPRKPKVQANLPGTN